MSRLGSNSYSLCGICGERGHRDSECSLADHYHKQAIKAVLAGRATPDDIKEAYRPVTKQEPLKL